MSMETKIKDYINQDFLFTDNGTLSNDVSSPKDGIVDSTGVLELVMFVEDA